jgi:hypothetical protein
LESLFRSQKSIRAICNIVDDMNIDRERPSQGYTDNFAMLKFVQGNAVTKGVKHMEMRLCSTRMEYLKGDIIYAHMPGTLMPADLLTKLGHVSNHRIFTANVLGHGLLGDKWTK